MGERIRAARTREGMTQAQAANESGLGDAAVRLYELGKRTPSDEVLARVAKTLGVTPESLMNLTPSTEREALEMLFRLEERYGCCPQAPGGNVTLCFGNASSKLKGMVAVWAGKRGQLDRGEITEEDYSNWKSCFKALPWELP